jgi:hypothetical protein
MTKYTMMLPTTMLGGLPRQNLATNGYILIRATSIKVREAKARARQKPGKGRRQKVLKFHIKSTSNQKCPQKGALVRKVHYRYFCTSTKASYGPFHHIAHVFQSVLGT